MEKYTAVENQLEKVTRDKMSLSNELDEIKAEFRLHTKETTVVRIDAFLYSSTLQARCSSAVRAFAHGAMGLRIDSSWGGPIEPFLVPASAPRLV